MLRQLWINFVTSYKEFSGTGPVLVLFVVALMLLILINSRNDNENKNLSCLLGGVATIGLALSKFARSIFNREYVKKSEKYFNCIFALVLCVFAVALSGKRVFARSIIEKSDNAMHISKEMTEAADIMLKNEPAGEIRVYPGPELGDVLMAYSSRFVCGYEEKYGDVSEYDEDVQKAYLELSKVHPDMEAVADSAVDTGCKYVIVKTGLWPEIPISEYGFETVFENEGYVVYKYVGEVSK